MAKTIAKDVTAFKHLGAWMLSAIVGRGIYAYREHGRYEGYTKKEAIRLFLEKCNQEGNK